MRFLSILAAVTAALSLSGCVSMIHRHANRGDVEAVRQELNEGAELEGRNASGETPLIVAAREGNMEIVRLLVERGADVNAQLPPERGQVTPLRYAIDREDVQMVRYLVENGAKVDHTNTHGWTPLMTAAREGNRDIMEYLIQHGANVDARTDEGTSVMRVAGNHGWTDIVVWLTLMMETGSETAEDG